MSFLVNPYSFGSGGGGLPTRSLDFERSSSQYLSMSDANFGSYDRAKFAISAWLKRESTGSTDQGIIGQSASGQRAFVLQFENDKLAFYSFADGTNVNGGINTTATYSSTTNDYHVLLWFDSANATAGDRIRLWVDGSEISSFSFDTNPTSQVYDSSADVTIGRWDGFYDGLVYQLGFFSGTLPTIGDVYDAGSPKDISGLPGLHAYLDCAGNDPTSDGVLAANWTNNNSVTTSTDIPT